MIQAASAKDSLLIKAGKVDAMIIEALQRLEDGKVMDLSELNIRVQELCDAIIRTPPEDPKNTTKRLNSIVHAIESLEKKMKALSLNREDGRGY
ncbi:MAG TPA: hypothetical protein ENI79_06515 [Rhodospirillales bacterium]|nr:hypothetical protein [Rhodospirillales bacterium]